jgi:hypothetical protein
MLVKANGNEEIVKDLGKPVPVSVEEGLMRTFESFVFDTN